MNQIISAVVILAFVAIGAQAGKEDAEMMAAALKCQTEVNATPADMEALQKFSMELTHEAKCVISCMMKNCGFLSADGIPQKDTYMKKAEEFTKGDAGMMQQAVEIYEKCSVLTDADICEKAFKLGACMKTEMDARKIPFDM